MKKIVLLIALVMMLSACSYLKSFFPDKRVEYKKSESTPQLEVPPDLTADAINDSMGIPGEEAPATLSQYKRRRASNLHQDQTPIAGADEQWVSVKGSAADIWPKLRAFFTARGFSLELDDAELGVLVTNWSEPEYQGGLTYRNKFKVFSETGAAEDMTVLYISNMRQEQVSAADGGQKWIDQGQNLEAEKRLAGELNVYFNGSSQALN